MTQQDETPTPDFAAMIAAVREAIQIWDSDIVAVVPPPWLSDLRAVVAVLEGIADREWLARQIVTAAIERGLKNENWLYVADALRAALLARAGGGNG